MAAAVTYRPAALDDAADIFPVAIELAGELPVPTDTLEREEALYELIRRCTRSGESWLALDEAGRIVGFALAEPDQLRRHYAEHEVIELRHAGVAQNHRRRGVFTELMRRLIDRMLPLAATISPANRADMPRRLEQLGFRRLASPGGELRFRRDPGGHDTEKG